VHPINEDSKNLNQSWESSRNELGEIIYNQQRTNQEQEVRVHNTNIMNTESAAYYEHNEQIQNKNKNHANLEIT
jgi:hypothetical protein